MRTWISFVVLCFSISACAGQRQTTSPTAALLPLPSATPIPAVATPAATPVIIASPTFTPTPVTYVVQKGDTLIGIAVKYGVSVEALQAANNNVQPQFLSIGQVLIIPSPEGEPVVNPGVAPTPVPIPLTAPACYPTPTAALYCFVEAQNPLDAAIENVSARITLAGADGLPLASAVAYSALDVIPPRSAAPLAALFQSAPTGIAATGAELLSANPSADPSAHHVALDIPAHNGAASDAQGVQWTVAGQVRNPSATPAASAWLVLTLYDSSDGIVGYRKQAIEGGLAPGATADFSVSAASLGGPVDHYRIAAEGKP